ncbi:GntR family transcriptional regulator [Gluconacetobacter sacchari]|uniref:GntR family transcriptional regulator n=2 Tax=Gluconacetobacter sacchari TaxID=92759 RepID=A0A7W4IAM5_9PROT|nr:GntR family transcriptional regulator [Gluconacetobacter sacchari]MBB2159277.1 GntR family transcriptional regulator [Gluconacetobacter sacchari]GBQ20497.1 GntR family transcriptional regulator [Gluconacetobacter sacchari DSM 12717]
MGHACDGLFRELAPDAGSRQPLYLQLEAGLSRLIESGALRRGDAVPPERLLADMTGVSRVTVRKALERLVETGRLTQRPGAGTFVAGRIEQPLSVLLGFSEEMRARGRLPGSVWLERGGGPAGPDEAMALGVAPGTALSRLKRIRTADGEPMAIETAIVAREDLPAPEAVADSFYAALKARGLAPVRALQRIRAGLAGAREAELLGLARPSPILRIERRSFLADGRLLEVTFSAYRADLYDFVVELGTDGAGD